MAYPLDRPHFNTLERIAPSVVLDVPAGIPTFLLDVAFFLPAFRTTLISFAALLNPDWTLPERRCYCVVWMKVSRSYGFYTNNDTHSVPLSVSTTISFSLTVALFHKPLLEKHPQPHFSQLSKDTASHKAHASINNRYTIKGTETTVAVGKVDKLLS